MYLVCRAGASIDQDAYRIFSWNIRSLVGFSRDFLSFRCDESKSKAQRPSSQKEGKRKQRWYHGYQQEIQKVKISNGAQQATMNEEKAEIDDHDEIDVPDLEENLQECLNPDAFTNSI